MYQHDSGSGMKGMNYLWDWDMSFGGSGAVNYTDTTHPQSGASVDLLAPGGVAWQPGSYYNSGHPPGSGVGPFGFDMSGYTWMTFDIWTAYPNNDYDLRWEYLGNVNAGTGDQVAPGYVDNILNVPGVTALKSGNWTTVRIPLAFFGHLGMHAAYKFYIRDNSNNTGAGSGSSQDFYLDNVGFVPGSYSWIYDGGAVTGWNTSTSTWNWDPSTLLNGWSDASQGASADYSFNPSSLTGGLSQGDAASLNGVKTPGYGSSITETNVIKLSVSSAGGMWKVTTEGFALSPYQYLTFGLLPTQSTHAYVVQFYDTSGKPVGNAVDPKSYTNADRGPSGGYWTIYSIPLSAFGTLPTLVGGLSIQDTSGLSSNTIYISAPGFFN